MPELHMMKEHASFVLNELLDECPDEPIDDLMFRAASMTTPSHPFDIMTCAIENEIEIGMRPVDALAVADDDGTVWPVAVMATAIREALVEHLILEKLA